MKYVTGNTAINPVTTCAYPVIISDNDFMRCEKQVTLSEWTKIITY